jgi:hypothetical protein
MTGSVIYYTPFWKLEGTHLNKRSPLGIHPPRTYDEGNGYVTKISLFKDVHIPMGDIHIEISKDGHASVRLSDNFLSKPLEEQVKGLEALLHSSKIQLYPEYIRSQTALEVKTRIVESLLSALKEGIRLRGVGWNVKGPIETLTRDITQEYWLRRSD